MSTQEIKTKLTLDGVQAATSDLKKLGEEGASAFNKIQSAADKVGGGFGGKLDATINSLRKSFADLGKASKDITNSFSAVQRSSLEVGAALGTVVGRVGIAAGAIAGATGAFFTFTKSAADNADNLSDVAEGLGLTTKAFQELAFAAQLSGLSQEDFAGGISKLNIVLGDALSGSKDAAKKFQELGVALRDANGNARPTEEILKDLADAIAKIPDAATRASVGSDFFGKSIAKWLPLLDSGRAGIEELQKQFTASGLGFTDQDINSAKAFNDALDVLFKSIQQLKDKAFLKFAEPFAKAFDDINAIIVANSDKIIAKSEEIAKAVGPIFEDIINAFLGNDRDIKAQWIADLKTQIVEFGTAAYHVFTDVVTPALNAFMGAADKAAEIISLLVPGEISGKALLLALAVGKLSGAFGLLKASTLLAWNSGKLVYSLFGVLGPSTTVLGRLLSSLTGIVGRLGLALVGLAISNPWLLGIAALAGGIAYLALQQTDAEKAAQAHADALSALDEIRGEVDAGITGSTDKLEQWKNANMEAASAALNLAESQFVFAQQNLDKVVWETGQIGEEWIQNSAEIKRASAAVNEQREAIRLARQRLSDITVGYTEARKSADSVALAQGRITQGTLDTVQASNQVKAGFKQITVYSGLVAKAVDVPIDSLAQAQQAAGSMQQTLSEPTQAAFLEDAQARVQTFNASISDLSNTIQSQLIQLLAAASAQIAALVEALPQFFEGFSDSIVAPFEIVRDKVSEIFSGFGAMANQGMAEVVSAVASAVSSIDQMISSVISKLQTAVIAAASLRAQASSSYSQGHASGGYISGPGTGTSDSIPARLSNGEYVIRAAAVKKYGPSIFSALNQMRLPKGAIPQFNVGGLVESLSASIVPRFAAGGLVAVAAPSGGGRPVNLYLGDKAFPMMASPSVIDELVRESGQRAVRRAGRKPSWYGA